MATLLVGVSVVALFVIPALFALPGKMLGDELRARIDDLPVLFVRLALRLLPEDMRAYYEPDWEGNLLAAFNDETSRYPVARFFRAFKFGFSLIIGARLIRKEAIRQTAKNDEEQGRLAQAMVENIGLAYRWIPTRGDVQAYTTEHLVNAAEYLDTTAGRCTDVFLQVRNQAHSLVWEGSGGDALRARTASDYTDVCDHADLLRWTSRIAREQADELAHLRNRVVCAVEGAERAGFQVGEDWSVTDTRSSNTADELGARQSQAQVFAANIRHCVDQLLGRSYEVGGYLTAASRAIGNFTFTD